jgi:hypothetical protein
VGIPTSDKRVYRCQSDGRTDTSGLLVNPPECLLGTSGTAAELLINTRRLLVANPQLWSCPAFEVGPPHLYFAKCV